MQELVLKKVKTSKEVIKKAEVKIAIIIIYYTLTGVIGMVAFTYFNVVNIMNTISKSLGELFLCESTGTQDCTDVNLDTFNTLTSFSLVANIMVTFSSVVAVVFSLDPKALKMTLHKYKAITFPNC